MEKLCVKRDKSKQYYQIHYTTRRCNSFSSSYNSQYAMCIANEIYNSESL